MEINDAPIRLCCGQRHFGPVCPDGLVMCILCFERVSQEDLNVTSDGNKEDVCRTCAEVEKSHIEERRRLHRLHPVKINKKWGNELCLVTKHTTGVAGYSGKILSVNFGWQCSIHYHVKKTETFFVLFGSLELEIYKLKHGCLVDNVPLLSDVVLECKYILPEGSGMTLEPLTMHRFWATKPEGCKFAEFSTPDDPEDSFRIVESCRKDE